MKYRPARQPSPADWPLRPRPRNGERAGARRPSGNAVAGIALVAIAIGGLAMATAGNHPPVGAEAATAAGERSAPVTEASRQRPAGLGRQEVHATQTDPEPTAFAGSRACGQCHVAEYRHWIHTPHAEAHLALRSERGWRIRGRLGGDGGRPVGDARCLPCHRQPRAEDVSGMAVFEGVGCESCHGPAGGPGGWLNVHASFGPGVRDPNRETPQHRQQRLRRCDAAGMRRAEHVVELADACLRCHAIFDSALIEAGHPDGLEFDVAAAIEGHVRHNFHTDPSRNAAVPSLWLVRTGGPRERYQAARRVLGAVHELEVAARTAAQGPAGGAAVQVAWGRAAERRRRLQYALAEVARGTPSGDAARTLPAWKTELAAFLAAMAEVERRTRPALLPNARPIQRWKRTAFVFPSGAEGAGAARPEHAKRLAAAVWAGRFDILGAVERDDGRDAPGGHESRTAGHTNADGERAWVGVRACAECHEAEYAAWQRSSHARSWAAIGTPRGRRYAAVVGGDTTSCRRCHAPGEAFAAGSRGSSGTGTTQIPAAGRTDPRRLPVPDSARAPAVPAVVAGVGCEACHGSAGGVQSGWIDVHADPSLSRRERSAEAARRGMIRPADLVALARRCVSCHIVDDPRLVSAGHPAGGDWEFVGWTAGEVRHNLRVDPGINDVVPSLMREYGEVRPADRRRKKFLIGVLTSVLRCSSVLERSGFSEDASDHAGWPDPATAAWQARRLLWLAVLREALQRLGDDAPSPLRRLTADFEAANDPSAQRRAAGDSTGRALARLPEILRWLERQQSVPWAGPVDEMLQQLPVRGNAYSEQRR